MTQTKAQTVVAAVVAAGYDATVHFNQATSVWTVTVTAPTFTIDSAVVANFVSSQGIVGTSQQVLLS
jgi:hypothetical protein